MTSKAAKKRAKVAARKAGRPRLEDAERMPCGKILYPRPEQTERAVEVAVNARIRQLGVSREDAKRPELGYPLGRLMMSGAFGSKDGKPTEQAWAMLKAGNRMAEDFARYRALVGLPPTSARAQDLNATRGFSHAEPRQDQVRRATDRMMAVEKVLGSNDEAGRPVTSLVKRLVLNDEDASNWSSHMVAKVKRGLIALSAHYGLDDAQGGD